MYISHKVIVVIGINLDVNSWIQWIVAGISIAIVYILIGFPIFLTDRGFRSLITDLKSKLKK